MTLGPLMLDIAGLTLQPDEVDRLRDPLVGGVILFSRNYADREQVRALVADIRAVRTPPILVAVDQEGGRVQRFRQGFYPLPPLRWFGHQYDVDPDEARRLAFRAGWLMAAELRDVGVDFSFAPVVDLDYGTSQIIGDRAFHRDPDAVAALALAWSGGMHKAGMAAVAKHFPGHGYVTADSHLELPVDHRPQAALFDDLLPYGHLIGSGIDGIMIAHVRYPRVAPEVASLSPWWIRTSLRDTLGFRGVIFTDDLTMRALDTEGDMGVRVRRSLGAGADMALICNDPAAADSALHELQGYAEPASHGRLVSIRARGQWPVPPGGLAGLADWRRATAALDAALARPGLSLT